MTLLESSRLSSSEITLDHPAGEGRNRSPGAGSRMKPSDSVVGSPYRSVLDLVVNVSSDVCVPLQ